MDKVAIASFLVRCNGFAPFRFLNSGKLPILMYHRFSEGEEFGKTSCKTFETHLDYLTRHYRVVSLTEVVSRIADGKPLRSRCAVITIDDGYRDFYEVAFPILRKFGVPATLYVVTDFIDGKCWIWTDKARFILSGTSAEKLQFDINGKKFDQELGYGDSRLSLAGRLNSEMKKLGDEEKDGILLEFASAMKVDVPETPPDEFGALSWEQARQLENAEIEIGSHTMTHPILTNVDSERLEFELASSRRVIQEKLQKDAVHFCYPNGNVSDREREAAENLRYTSAVTTEIRLCENGDDRFLLPRIDAEPELHRFVQATSGFDRIKGVRK